MMRRRGLLTFLAVSALAPRAFAQSKPPVLVGWLSFGTTESRTEWLAAFKEGLASLGWKEGQQVVFEVRSGDASAERLATVARELVAKRPAVIVSSGLRPATVLAEGKVKIPVVLVGGDPILAGLAAGLARPGGMVTGMTNVSIDFTEKFLELLLVAAPKLRRVGILGYPHNPNYAAYVENARRSAARFSIEPRFGKAVNPEEIETELPRMAKEGAQALIVLAGALFTTERARIIKIALKYRWPVIAGYEEFAEDGALLSYGADTPTLYRRAAYYVDRILKGAKPSDLPIEQPTKFELVVNMKTAKAIGLTIPQELVLRADRVIE